MRGRAQNQQKKRKIQSLTKEGRASIDMKTSTLHKLLEIFLLIKAAVGVSTAKGGETACRLMQQGRGELNTDSVHPVH